jgi:alkanesulfonate monooxygenase SsuD/methylene tetrahydromethanopterin reductase-like flavin-dependent oxidoreductase (luciferase family)
MRIGVNPGQWGWAFARLEESWREAERLGFSPISCFDHITAAPRGLAAWDAPSLLTAMALHTSQSRISVNVIDAALRHPLLLAGQVAVAQAASRGRVHVGLGLGAQHLAPFDFRATGREFPPRHERVATLAAMLEVLPALWRGETVTEPSLGVHDASLGPLEIAVPPLIVGGRSRAVLELAARHADGWNAVVTNAEQFSVIVERLDALCEQVGRSRPLARTAQVFLSDVSLEALRDLLQRLQAAGADETVIVLTRDEGPDQLARLADATAV